MAESDSDEESEPTRTLRGSEKRCRATPATLDTRAGDQPNKDNVSPGKDEASDDATRSTTSLSKTLIKDEPPNNGGSGEDSGNEEPDVEQKVCIKSKAFQISPCCKDIDLKAIESEMKGLDRPIKKEEGANTLPHSYDGPRLQRMNLERKPPEVYTNKRLCDSPNEKHDPIVLLHKTPPDDKINCKYSSDPKSSSYDCFEDDIYEFREPEPFEIGEMRSRKEGRGSRGSLASPQDESEVEPKSGKKKPRPRRDIDSDASSETESESVISPKKICWDKEGISKLETTPNKNDFRLTSIKKEVDIDEQHPTIRETHATPSNVDVKSEMPCSVSSSVTPTNTAAVTTSGSAEIPSLPLANASVIRNNILSVPNVSCPLKTAARKEPTVLPKSMQPINATDIKVVKLDMSAAGSPLSKLSQGEVVGKVTSIACPRLDFNNTGANVSGSGITATRVVSAGSHILAQVLPPKQSRALAKLSKDAPPNTNTTPVSTTDPDESIAFGQAQQCSSPNPSPVGSIRAVNAHPMNLSTASGKTSNNEEENSAGAVLKAMSFIKRQQQIFPHLLNRPGGDNSASEAAKSCTGVAITNQVSPPSGLRASAVPTSVQPLTGSPPSGTAQHPQDMQHPLGAGTGTPAKDLRPFSPTQFGEPKLQSEHPPCQLSMEHVSNTGAYKAISSPPAQSSVGESIESVIQKAIQNTGQYSMNESFEENSLSDSGKSPDKKRKLVGRGKKKDVSEAFESDEVKLKTDLEKRNKKFKSESFFARSPKRENTKKHVGKRKDDEENCESKCDSDHDSSFIIEDNSKIQSDSTPVRSLRKKQRGASTPKLFEEQHKVSAEVDEEEQSKQMAESSDVMDTDAAEAETGFGDLLCEETIPPGSPMTQDTLVSDTEMSLVDASHYASNAVYNKQQLLHSQLSPLMATSPLLARGDQQQSQHAFARQGIHSSPEFNQLHHHFSNQQVSAAAPSSVIPSPGSVTTPSAPHTTVRWNNFQPGSLNHSGSPSPSSPPSPPHSQSNPQRRRGGDGGSTIFASQSANNIINNSFSGTNNAKGCLLSPSNLESASILANMRNNVNNALHNDRAVATTTTATAGGGDATATTTTNNKSDEGRKAASSTAGAGGSGTNPNNKGGSSSSSDRSNNATGGIKPTVDGGGSAAGGGTSAGGGTAGGGGTAAGGCPRNLAEDRGRLPPTNSPPTTPESMVSTPSDTPPR